MVLCLCCLAFCFAEMDPYTLRRFNQEIENLNSTIKQSKVPDNYLVERLERLTQLRDGDPYKVSIAEHRRHRTLQAKHKGLTEEEYEEFLVSRARDADFSEHEIATHRVLVWNAHESHKARNTQQAMQ